MTNNTYVKQPLTLMQSSLHLKKQSRTRSLPLPSSTHHTTCHMPHATCHMPRSCTTCHMPCTTCYTISTYYIHCHIPTTLHRTLSLTLNYIRFLIHAHVTSVIVIYSTEHFSVQSVFLSQVCFFSF
jgi:hypothetical protein